MKKVLIASLLIFLSACSSSDGGSDSNGDNYDRTVLLTNWADNIIIPSFENYQSKVALLTSKTETFNANPTIANLQILRTSWLDAYKAYQYTSMYDFGKAPLVYYNESANTYPTNTIAIEANISSGTYNLTLLSQLDKQGLPALDYLINGLDSTDAGIISFYSSNPNAVKYKNYLTALVTRLKSTIDQLVTDWNTSYRDTYVASNGTTVSSSVNITANNFVKNFEKTVRTGKIGIPAGVFSAGTLYPEKVEAFYKNDISKILLTESIKATEDFFNGKYFGSSTTGESLKSYLDFVNAVRDGQKLSAIINAQFATIYSSANVLNASFSQQVISDNSKMLESYAALQQNVIYTKLDMMQALNISIDYVDSDGD